MVVLTRIVASSSGFWESFKGYLTLYPKRSTPGERNTYPLVICYIAIENGHRNSGFTP
jgi:hypothetical protein